MGASQSNSVPKNVMTLCWRDFWQFDLEPFTWEWEYWMKNGNLCLRLKIVELILLFSLGRWWHGAAIFLAQKKLVLFPVFYDDILTIVLYTEHTTMIYPISFRIKNPIQTVHCKRKSISPSKIFYQRSIQNFKFNIVSVHSKRFKQSYLVRISQFTSSSSSLTWLAQEKYSLDNNQAMVQQ
jgi:hypothetical protein